MILNRKLYLIVIFALFAFTTCKTQEVQKSEADFSQLIGPYLGQKPPGMTPEVFAPGIVSTDSYEFACCFSPVMGEILDLRICSSASEIRMLSDLPSRRRVS